MSNFLRYYRNEILVRVSLGQHELGAGICEPPQGLRMRITERVERLGADSAASGPATVTPSIAEKNQKCRLGSFAATHDSEHREASGRSPISTREGG